MPVVKFSELSKNLRFDSEFYSDENQRLMAQLKKFNLIELGNCVHYIKDTGKFSLYKSEFLSRSGVPFLRASDIKNNVIDFSETVFIPEYYHKKLKNSALRHKDILLTTKGVIGKSACLSAKIECNISQNLVRIGIDEKRFNPFFVSAFLNCKFGRFQTNRLASGNMQPYLNFENIRRILIPELPLEFQNLIESLVLHSEKLRKQAKTAFLQAEKYLLQEIALENVKNPQENTNSLNFNESFGKTKRLDAEYYSKISRFIEEQIKNYPGGFGTVEAICEIKDQNFIPDKEKSYKYIELNNITKTGAIQNVRLFRASDLPNRAKRIVQEGDVIISSIQDSFDKCAIIPKAFSEALCSTGFYVLNSKTINAETLYVYFKSKILRRLMQKAGSGTILISANRKDFGVIPIPKIKTEIQNQISNFVKKSLGLLMFSNEILEKIPQKVEKYFLK